MHDAAAEIKVRCAATSLTRLPGEGVFHVGDVIMFS